MKKKLCVKVFLIFKANIKVLKNLFKHVLLFTKKKWFLNYTSHSSVVKPFDLNISATTKRNSSPTLKHQNVMNDTCFVSAS